MPTVCGSTATVSMDRRCRSSAVLPPMYLWLGVADRVRCYRHKLYGSALPTVCGATATDTECRLDPIPSSETGRVHIACGFQEPRRSVRRRCPLQHPCSCCRRGTGVAGAPASNDLTLWCGLHSWRFMPPVCTGALVVAGSHTLAGEWPVFARTNLAACAPDYLLVPFVGRWTP